MTEATWLPKPTSTVTMPATARTVPAAPPVIRKPPPKAKPNPKLLNAAKGCGRLDDWHGQAAECKRQALPSGARPPFDMRKYEREFDPFVHGYFRKNGGECLMFRFPDGWVERVSSSVNRITEDGRLVPG
jgi:hypothetical protein